LNTPIAVTRRDELGRLGTEFERMRQHLARNYSELQDKTKGTSQLLQNLEHERANLQKTNAELENSRKAVLNILEDADLARWQSEEARNRYEAILEGIGDSVVVVDINRKVSLVNAQARKLLAIRNREIAGEHLFELMKFVDEHGKTTQLQVDRALGDVVRLGGIHTIRRGIYLRHSRRGVVPIDITLSAVAAGRVSPREGDVGSVILAFHDITKRVETEQKTRNLLKIEAFMRKSSVEMIATDTHTSLSSMLADLGRVVDVSRIYVFEFNESMSKLKQGYEWVAKGVPRQADSVLELEAGDFPLAMQQIREHQMIKMDDVGACPEANMAAYLKSQGVKSMVLFPLFVGDKTYGIMGFDETREMRKWSEDTINTLKLASGIISSALKRQEIESMSEEVNRMKTEFVSIASHQLRTPLTAIRWMMELARKRTDNLDANQVKYLAEVDTSVKRMIDLVNDLLSLSRIESGKLEVNIEPVDLRQTVEQVAADLVGLAEEKRIQMSVTFDPEAASYRVMADTVQIRQVVQNLVSNAIKYTPEDGQVGVILHRKRGAIRFECTDSGIGVPAAQQKRLFSKFFRADNVTTLRSNGTGLGLYIAKTLMASFGGTIGCRSSEGQGSTFYFSMPAMPLRHK